MSFRYPGSDQLALDNVSFTLSPGQLCVIGGANGSGKSTILKLAVRLYDPSAGTILLGGHDVRTLRLADLRAAIAVLFQDYTHFPLSIRDNIALGDPDRFHDDARVRAAARPGGAAEFVESLPDRYETYLDRPVRDYFSGMPEGTRTLFGRQIDFAGVRGAGGMASRTGGPALSGGQMQRLAVSRTFMRSVVSEDARVGLLLFDEPSASLDPTAEHGACGFGVRFGFGVLMNCCVCRFVRAAEGAEGEQDDGVLVAPVREPDAACGSHLVRVVAYALSDAY